MHTRDLILAVLFARLEFTIILQFKRSQLATLLFKEYQDSMSSKAQELAYSSTGQIIPSSQ